MFLRQGKSLSFFTPLQFLLAPRIFSVFKKNGLVLDTWTVLVIIGFDIAASNWKYSQIWSALRVFLCYKGCINTRLLPVCFFCYMYFSVLLWADLRAFPLIFIVFHCDVLLHQVEGWCLQACLTLSHSICACPKSGYSSSVVIVGSCLSYLCL